MKDSIWFAVIELIRLFVGIIQALIAYTVPGILFLASVAVVDFPSTWLPFTLTIRNDPWLQVCFFLILPMMIGRLLFALGSICFMFLAERFSLDQLIEQDFIERQARLIANSTDPLVSGVLQTESPLSGGTAELRIRTANVIVRRRISRGIVGASVVQLSEAHRLPREIQALLFAIETELGAAYGLFGASIMWALTAIWYGALFHKALIPIAGIGIGGLSLIFCLIWHRTYCQTRYSLFVGLGEILEEKDRLA